MTLIVVIVFGFGVVLMGSALDNSPLLDTFNKVLHGTPLDWSGKLNDTTGKPLKSK